MEKIFAKKFLAKITLSSGGSDSKIAASTSLIEILVDSFQQHTFYPP